MRPSAPSPSTMSMKVGRFALFCVLGAVVILGVSQFIEKRGAQNFVFCCGVDNFMAPRTADLA